MSANYILIIFFICPLTGLNIAFFFAKKYLRLNDISIAVFNIDSWLKSYYSSYKDYVFHYVRSFD
ncbi:MAG: hypothetical protein BWK78_04755 [Thiotrichaceae bacterium IS1]|nr:MAG: hypothetical protein BWK78_04755 [Thiotrichaceae bacterium IS1]